MLHLAQIQSLLVRPDPDFNNSRRRSGPAGDCIRHQFQGIRQSEKTDAAKDKSCFVDKPGFTLVLQQPVSE